MRCARCQKDLFSYLLGELDAAKRAALEQHLGQCPACRKHQAALAASWNLLGDAPQLQPSEDFDAGFARKLAAARAEQAMPAQRAKRLWIWGIPALATGAAATAALIFTLNTRPLTPTVKATNAGGVSDIELAMHAELLRDFDVIDNLDALENADVLLSLESLMEQRK